MISPPETIDRTLIEQRLFQRVTTKLTKVRCVKVPLRKYGGERGIRTLGTVARTTVFETAPFDHSGTSPRRFRALSGQVWAQKGGRTIHIPLAKLKRAGKEIPRRNTTMFKRCNAGKQSRIEPHTHRTCRDLYTQIANQSEGFFIYGLKTGIITAYGCIKTAFLGCSTELFLDSQTLLTIVRGKSGRRSHSCAYLLASFYQATT